MLSVPGLIIPLIALPSQSRTRIRSSPCTAFCFQVPSHEPLSGWPSWAERGARMKSPQATSPASATEALGVILVESLGEGQPWNSAPCRKRGHARDDQGVRVAQLTEPRGDLR